MCVRAQRQQGDGCAEGRSWCWAQGQAAEPEPEGAEHIGKVNFLPVGASIPKVHKVQKEVASEGVLPIRFENVPPALFPVLPGGTDLPPSQTSFLKCPPPTPDTAHSWDAQSKGQCGEQGTALMAHLLCRCGSWFVFPLRTGVTKPTTGSCGLWLSAACLHSLWTRTRDLRGHLQPPPGWLLGVDRVLQGESQGRDMNDERAPVQTLP